MVHGVYKPTNMVTSHRGDLRGRICDFRAEEAAKDSVSRSIFHRAQCVSRGHGDVREMPRGHVENIYDYDYSDYKLLLDLFDLFDLFGVNVDHTNNHTFSLHIPRISSWYVETLVFPFLLVDGWRLFGSIDSSTARFGSWASMGMREQLDLKTLGI